MENGGGHLQKITPKSFSPARYLSMKAAISACVSIDDCMEAQSVAAAMRVYFVQINDFESVRQVNEIRLRAWRKMSEIIATVDVSKCSTQKKMAERVRAELGSDATMVLTDSKIIMLIKLAGVPDSAFEAEVERGTKGLSAIIQNGHPDEIRKACARDEAERINIERHHERAAKESATFAENTAAEDARAERQAKALMEELHKNGIMETPEVGLTLTAQNKAGLVTFSVMMDRTMHEQLRDAAHVRRTTMWAILREATNYWFVVNGYKKV